MYTNYSFHMFSWKRVSLSVCGPETFVCVPLFCQLPGPGPWLPAMIVYDLTLLLLFGFSLMFVLGAFRDLA